jgi:peptidoglycan hydrolase CwlO-like protein
MQDHIHREHEINLIVDTELHEVVSLLNKDALTRDIAAGSASSPAAMQNSTKTALQKEQGHTRNEPNVQKQNYSETKPKHSQRYKQRREPKTTKQRRHRTTNRTTAFSQQKCISLLREITWLISGRVLVRPPPSTAVTDAP